MCQQAVPSETQITGLQLWASANYALGFQAEPWERLPSADGTELASLSTGKQWPEETVSTQPRAPVSRDLNPKAQQPVPSPRTRQGPWTSPAAGREGGREADQLQRQGAPEKSAPERQRQPGSPVVRGPTRLRGAELLLNHGCESSSRPGDLQPGVTLPFPHPAGPAPQGASDTAVGTSQPVHTHAPDTTIPPFPARRCPLATPRARGCPAHRQVAPLTGSPWRRLQGPQKQAQEHLGEGILGQPE